MMGDVWSFFKIHIDKNSTPRLHLMYKWEHIH